MPTETPTDPFLALALGTTALSALLLLWFLLRRPRLTRVTKIVLLLGIGVFPLMTAATGNVAGFHATTQRSFCGSCHVMAPYRADSDDLASMSLAARHARNASFGAQNCYACHANYGMYGTLLTKLGGLRHVYEYSLHYRNMPIEQFLATIEIRQPFQSATCIHCHSTQNPIWLAVGEHASTLASVRDGTLMCASSGCHGPAHAFSKAAKLRAQAARP